MNPKHYMLLGSLLYILYQFNIYLIIVIVFTFISVLLGLLYYYQSNILYQANAFPQYKTVDKNPAGYRLPSERNLPYETVYLTTSDNVKLHCWFIRVESIEQRKQRPTILFLHANAGNLGFRMDNLVLMYNTLQCNILIIDYRGYGYSTGIPSETGMIIDSITAYNWLYNNDTIDNKRLFVFGRSLGGSVAIALCNQLCADKQYHTNTGICGMIIENTFTNIAEMAEKMFFFLKHKFVQKYMITLKWPAIDRIQSIYCPILFLSSTADEIVPSYMMQQLYDAAHNALFKTMHHITGANHNNAFQVGGDKYIDIFIQFMNECCTRVDLHVDKIVRGDIDTANDIQQSAETEWLDVTDEIVNSATVPDVSTVTDVD